MQRLRLASNTDAGVPRPGLVVSELLALQVIRRSLAKEPFDVMEDSSWREAGRVLRRAHAEMLRYQKVGLVVADEGTLLLTRHEKRLIRAIGAAQIPDPALIDNLIFTLAPGCAVRPFLAHAVSHLAIGLAQHGHVIPPAVVSAAVRLPSTEQLL